MDMNQYLDRTDLDFSLDGEINRIFFYSDYNCINIFVEDKDKEFEYEAIFHRMFGNELSLETTFGVGGKNNLKIAYELLKENSADCKGINIFLADLDFDYMLEKEMIHDDIFIYLDKYCIENYLMDKSAVLNFIQGRLCKRMEDVEKKVRYEFWFEDITKQFYELFLIFLVVQKIKPELANTGESTFKFIMNRSWEIDPAKLQRYYNDVKTHIPDLENELNEMKKQVKLKIGDKVSCIISGKYYFDSLKRYLLKFSGSDINDKDLRNALVKGFDITSLDFLKSAIIKVKKAYSLAS